MKMYWCWTLNILPLQLRRFFKNIKQLNFFFNAAHTLHYTWWEKQDYQLPFHGKLMIFLLKPEYSPVFANTVSCFTNATSPWPSAKHLKAPAFPLYDSDESKLHLVLTSLRSRSPTHRLHSFSDISDIKPYLKLKYYASYEKRP